ncbi:unnamed protein product, partial [Protopolystoma xenopodis]
GLSSPDFSDETKSHRSSSRPGWPDSADVGSSPNRLAYTSSDLIGWFACSPATRLSTINQLTPMTTQSSCQDSSRPVRRLDQLLDQEGACPVGVNLTTGEVGVFSLSQGIRVPQYLSWTLHKLVFHRLYSVETIEERGEFSSETYSFSERLRLSLSCRRQGTKSDISTDFFSLCVKHHRPIISPWQPRRGISAFMKE